MTASMIALAFASQTWAEAPAAEAAPDVSARAPEENMTKEEMVEGMMTRLDERLTLSQEQKAKIRPMVDEHLTALRSLREKFESEEVGMLTLMMEMRAADTTLDETITPILDAKQNEEYLVLRTEQREQILQRMMQRSSGL